MIAVPGQGILGRQTQPAGCSLEATGPPLCPPSWPTPPPSSYSNPGSEQNREWHITKNMLPQESGSLGSILLTLRKGQHIVGITTEKALLWDATYQISVEIGMDLFMRRWWVGKWVGRGGVSACLPGLTSRLWSLIKQEKG